jgi:glycosyltransferase involved in cell wall biosynthesis
MQTATRLQPTERQISRPRTGDSTPRVLQIGKFYAPLRGGMETHLKALCDGLSQHVDLEVIVSNKERSTVSEYVDGVRVTRLAQWSTVAGASVCPSMVWRIRQSRADIVHIHWPNPTALLAYLASGHKGRLLLTYHADTVRQRVLGPLFEPVLQFALHRAEAIIVSSIMIVRGSSTLADLAGRCVVIPFGIRLSDFDDYDPVEVQAIRSRFGCPLLLAVGRLVYYKGLEYLIRALADVDAKLLIIGEGPLRAPLEQAAAAAGVAGRVHFLGKVESVVNYYRACDLFVMPSTERAEAFGLVQLEAMACGKPVVNTWLPSGVPFVSLDDVTGLTVAPKSSSALAAGITKLLLNHDLRHHYGLAARRRVEEEFTQEVMIARTMDAYLAPSGAAAPGMRYVAS